MANIISAKKRARQTPKRAAVNRTRLTKVRTFIKKVDQAIEAGNKEAAIEALRIAQPIIQRGAQKRVISKGMAARKISRLAQAIKKIA